MSANQATNGPTSATAAPATQATTSAPQAAYGLPDRFHVKDEATGIVNNEASVKKMYAEYAQAEKRMKLYGLPPESADGYEYAIPEGVTLDAEMQKSFREAALDAGLTQKQYEFVMNSYVKSLGQLPELIDAHVAKQAEQLRPVMAEHWGGEQNLAVNLVRARIAATSVFQDAPEEVRANADMLGNSPAFLWLAAKIGQGMEEDSPPNFGGNNPQSTLDQLMRAGGPYWDPMHPEHARTKDAVTRIHQAQARRDN